MLVNNCRAMETNVDMTYCRRKKTRRGKKKYNQQLISDLRTVNIDKSSCGCVSQDVDNVVTTEADMMRVDNKAIPGISNLKMKQRKSKRSLRPYTSPRAPHNSTQFLIDDHLDWKNSTGICTEHHIEDEHSFYGSLKSTSIDQNNADQCLSPVIEQADYNWKTSPAFSDVDYEYMPMQNEEDMMTFFEEDFEREFRDAKESELTRKNKSELVFDVLKLANMANHLQELLHSTDLKHIPAKTECSSTTKDLDIAAIQMELQKLQEDQALLASENKRLKDRLEQ